MNYQWLPATFCKEACSYGFERLVAFFKLNDMFKNSIQRFFSKAFTLVLLTGYSFTTLGQDIYEQPEQLEALVLRKDSNFWQAYNQCDVNLMVSFLSEDLEFYHDKNGFTEGKSAMQKSLTNGLCANGPKLRREAKQGTVSVYPLKGIGAIISGEHSFFVGDKKDSEAKFTHIWTLKNNEWKMSRVISYDHQLANHENPQNAISIDENLLSKYAGNYEAPQTGKVVFTKADGSLKMNAGKMELALLAMSGSTFFHEQSSLTFEFVTDDAGDIAKVIVREAGKVVEEAKRVD